MAQKYETVNFLFKCTKGMFFAQVIVYIFVFY